MPSAAKAYLSEGAAPDPLRLAAEWSDAGHGVALATVIGTWGSAPRPAGSQLVVREDGAFEGSVSGGCIEGEVVTSALKAIEEGKPAMLEFGVSNTQAWEVGLACGGRITIYIEPVTGP